MHAPSPFDELAETYDDDFTSSAIGQLQRKRVWKYLLPLVNETGRPLNILEINCGTGADAMRLASMGHNIIATDASNAMIAKAKEKTSIDSVNIQFITCRFDQLGDHFAGQKFDLIFSNFGGLNCIDKKALGQLRDELGSLLTADGTLFFVVMGTYCMREIVHFGIRGKLKTAFRRLKRTNDLSVNGNSMPVYYYSPATLNKAFSAAFRLLQKQPIGLFIPPSYLEKRYVADPNKLARLDKREEKFATPFFAGLADHYCAIFKKTGTAQ